MKQFEERLEPKTTTRVLLSAVPYVIISRQALDKMYVYVDKCSDEVGWLATATRHGREIYIDDTYLFDQEVHATTTEITPDGLADFATELLQREDGIEIWNNLKVWGHSHVNMGVSPSGQDNDQMNTFKDTGHDWFLRLICNKKGEMKLDLYEYSTGIIYEDIPWEEEIIQEEEDLHAQIIQLQSQINAIRGMYADAHAVGVEDEMKVKVRKKTYGVVQTGKWNHSTHGKNNSTTGTKKNTGGQVASGSGNRKQIESYYLNDDDVVEDFSKTELYAIASENNLRMVEELLWQYGYMRYLTEDDVERIYRVAKKEMYKIGGEIK